MSNFFYEYKDGKVIKTSYDENQKIPLKGKKLKSLIKNKRKFSKTEIFSISKQLLEILDKMRSVFPPIVHKNISLSNIIVKKDLELALIGFNKEVRKSKYSAPEVLDNPTPKSDLYSVGKVVNEISNIEDKNFIKFILLMINQDPNKRFDNTKVAKDILKRIIDNRILESDWNLSKNRKSSIDDFGLKISGSMHHKESVYNPTYGNNWATNDYNKMANAHNSDMAAIDAYAAMYAQEERRERKFESPNDSMDFLYDDIEHIDIKNKNYDDHSFSPFVTALMIVGVVIVVIFIKQAIYEEIDEYLPCDSAPTGYYNDEECNIILMNEENRKKAFELERKRRLAREKKDAELRKKFKRSGLGGKY